MDQRNLILALVISVLIIFGWEFFIQGPQQRQQAQQAAQQAQQQAQQGQPTSGQPPAPQLPAGEAPQPAQPAVRDRAVVVAEGPRVPIDSPRLKGSILLKGGRIDDVVLKDYHVTVDRGSPNIELLNPAGAPEGYFAEWGWSPPGGTTVKLPDSTTVWQAQGDKLTASQPLSLTWDNGEGLRFTRTYAIDANFMFTVTDKVENTGAAPVTLYAYGRIMRIGTPKTLGFAIMHEGPLGVLDGNLVDKPVKYSNLKKAVHLDYPTTGGWLGITDKYWLTALVLNSKDAEKAQFDYIQGTDAYQTDFLSSARTIAPGASTEATSRLFAGAKEVKLLVGYRDALAIPLFDRAVDFAGYIGFLLTLIAKPLFYVLDFIYSAVGNFGISILLLTVMVKLIFFPLANKSYRSMSKMKKLTPEMQKLRERFKEDKQRLSQETMALYKREKVNPASGCLPMVVQIPVFIALYQVLFVTIEMRHAPFFGWIKDLSSPDPTSITNLFGLLPWASVDLGPLNIINIGVWPIIMGITMFLQQKLNPAPPDPVQAKMFMLLPIVFTFMLAHFPAGLVIYWAWNNLLSISQQRLIMWRMGVKA